MTLMTFDEVIRAIEKKNDRAFSLLLGNGFSMAFDTSIFSYNALNDFVRKQDNPVVTKMLEVVGTTDFERVMQHLDVLASLCGLFDKNGTIAPQVLAAKETLQRNLIEAVKELHPQHVFKVPEEKHVACSVFLRRFLESGGSLFTTNYDLLLYWVLMRSGLESVDGFGRDREDDGDEYTPGIDREYSKELRWGRNKGQNVFYLHGALPLFDAGTEVIKEQYDQDGYLLDKIKQRMVRGHYPLFVTAGNGMQKLEHIRHNHYLSDAYAHLEQLEGSLVVFGFNFGPQDMHIIRAINIAADRPKPHRLWSIYIGVYSDDDRRRAEDLTSTFKCQKVHLFDSKTASVWNS